MRGLLSIFILIVLLLLALPLAAQEESTEEAPLIESPVLVDEPVLDTAPDGLVNAEVSEQLYTLGLALFKLIWNAAYLPFAAPMVAVLVALFKRLPLNVSSPTWAFIWTIVLWIFFLAATQIGYADQFKTAVESLATLGATFLGITLTPALAGSVHAYANKKNVAIIGYSRPVAAETTGGSAQRPLTPIAENA